MSKLTRQIRIKKENYGTYRHDSYSIVIPYKTSQQMQLQDNMMLHATISEKTKTIRLYKKPLKDSTQIKIRHKLTKTYKNQRYHSTKITIPIQFIRDLKLTTNQIFNIYCTQNTIIIKSKR